ncbi:hypothetical protein EDC04DRAFT_2606521 [Pisolithus marmoratus]|nr:hypothetical protein EDC04DRAFT_2606521 [Pisolithus marmoratus]
MPVPAHYMDEEVNQLSFHVKAIGYKESKIIASTVNNVESDKVFDQPIYEEVLAGLKCKHSDHDDDYVTSSEVEDFNDGDVEVDDSNANFGVWPAKESHVTRTVNNGIKKLKVKRDAGQESEEKNTTAGQVFLTRTNGTGKHHHAKNRDLPSELMEEKLWARQVMPALLLWAGSLADPLNISDDNLMRANQHLCMWCNNFTSMVINIIAHYLISNPEIGVPSSADVKKMCSALLKDLTFIYLDQDMSKLTNAFWSHFILFLLAHAHLHPCAGCPDIDQRFKKKSGIKATRELDNLVSLAGVNYPYVPNGSNHLHFPHLGVLSEDGSNEDLAGDVDEAIDALCTNLLVFKSLWKTQKSKVMWWVLLRGTLEVALIDFVVTSSTYF